MRILRSKRVRTAEIDVRVCTATGRLMNISATGALVLTGERLPEGQECPVLLKARHEPAQLQARIVWAESLSTERGEPGSGEDQYLVAVRFTNVPPRAQRAVLALCGPASLWKE